MRTSSQGGVILPDYVKETFEDCTESGGNDEAETGRGLCYLEWCWDPDPNDTLAERVFAGAIRHADGKTEAFRDHQTFGVFDRATWRRLLSEVGFEVTSVSDPWRTVHWHPAELLNALFSATCSAAERHWQTAHR